MAELIDTKTEDGKLKYTFSVDVVVPREKTYTEDQLTARKTKLENKKANLEQLLVETEADIAEINALIALI
jgi:hypothetical protein